jgi:type I restriction enzyme, S subunit
MKEGWVTKTLADTCEMYQPKTISGKDMVEGGAYPVFGANGIIGRYDKFNHEEPQLLITCRGATCGSVNISEPNSWITGNAMVVRSRNGSIDRSFLEYLFRGGLDVSRAITGAAQPQITRTNLDPLEISYPESLAEQQRIVGILDEAFAGLATAKANAETNLQNARALFESHLQSVFSQRGEGWVDLTLDEVCIVERGSSPRPIKKYFTTESDGVNWIKIGDTEEGGKYVHTTGQKITPEGAKKSRYVEEGDFILTNSMSYGRPYIMKTSGYIHDGWFVLRLNMTLDADYFYYLLSSPVVQKQFAALASGSVVKNISGDLVKKAVLPIPPLDQQLVIVRKVMLIEEETQRLTAIYTRKLAALEELKKALLHQAFSGEL